jgi:hemoglobin
MKTEIETEDDVRLLVDKFYEKVNKDPLLSPVFNEEAGVNWEEHLPKMYKFWSTQLLGTGSYSGRPFPPHMELKIGKEHFERWLDLFLSTVDEYFTGPVAETARTKAKSIAAIFQYKLGLN